MNRVVRCVSRRLRYTVTRYRHRTDTVVIVVIVEVVHVVLFVNSVETKMKSKFTDRLWCKVEIDIVQVLTTNRKSYTDCRLEPVVM